MDTRDVIIVGGGPGGSSCARQLRKHGIDCLILDRESFPRLKLCAGWITPECVADLELDIEAYPHSFLSFDKLKLHLRGLSFSMNTVQHSIRRVEFDHWLLQRSGAEVITHDVKQIRRDNGLYVIDDHYRCKHLVGAGGTRCPVYRALFRQVNPRAKHLQAVAQEQEFPYDWQDSDCHLWFFEHGLPGYTWYVPKQNGYLNIGVGGMAAQLKHRNDDIKPHWHKLTADLEQSGRVTGHTWEPAAYSYYLRADVDVVQVDNAYLIGDAAGLATRDMCEGIGPAVRSGILAANAIASGTAYTLGTVNAYSGTNLLAKKALEYMFTKRR